MSKVYINIFDEAYKQDPIVAKNDLLTMGLVEEINNSPVSRSGEYFSEAYQNPLTDIGDASQITTSTTLTPNALGDGQRNVVVCHRGIGVYEYRLNDILRGIAGLNQISSQWAKYWALQLQGSLVAAMKGVMTKLTDHVLDVTATTSPYISIDNIDDTKILVGNEMNDLDAIIVNKYIYNDLKQHIGFEYQSFSAQFGGMMQNFLIPTISGMKVLINDTLCAASGTSHPVYLVKGKPVQLYWQRQLEVFEDFDPATGRGTDKLYTYIDYAPHVYGMTWDVSSKTNPTDAELAVGTYWTLATDTENIKMNQLIVKRS